ncbi:MAG: thioredoxin family protein [Planctomycetota bacterium]
MAHHNENDGGMKSGEQAMAVPPRSSLSSRVVWPLVFVLVGVGAWSLVNYAAGDASAGGAEAGQKGGLEGWQGSLEPAFASAKEQGKPILVYFSADWCPPCKMFKAEVLTQAATDALIKAETVPVLIDVDTLQDKGREAEVRLIQKLGVEFIPDMYLFSAAGEQVSRYRFDPSQDDLEAAFAAWLREGVKAAKADG